MTDAGNDMIKCPACGHEFVPWGELRWHEFEKTCLGWLSPEGLSRLRGERRNIVRVSGAEHLTGNGEI